MSKFDLQKEFEQQLRHFIEDESDVKEYDKYVPRSDKMLVKVFKFHVKEGTEGLGTSSILIQSPLDGAWKPKDSVLNEKIFPLVRVLKVGNAVENEDIKVGKIYVVPADEVSGDDWNPDFMWMMQNFAKQGKSSGQLVIPDDMDQKIPKIEKNWARYKFLMPDRIGDATDEDKLVFLVPTLKIEAEYLV
jgi:hypothetical protein